MDLQQVLNKLDDMMRKSDIDNVIPFLEESISQAEKEQDGGSVLSILNELVGFCRETCQYDKAMEYASRALTVVEDIGLTDTVYHATTMLNIANCLRAAGRLEDSLSTYKKVEVMYEHMLPKNDFGFASLYNNESLLYQELGDFVGAYESLIKALSIVKEYPDKKRELAATYINLTNTCLHIDTKDAESSVTDEEIEDYANKAIDLSKELGEIDTHYAAALTGKGQLMERKGNYDTAINCYEEALTAIKSTLGKTDFFNRTCDYLKAAVEKSGREYEGPYKDIVANNGNIAFISGLELDKDYYETVGKPMLIEKYGDSFDNMTIGMLGEGSDCFGFDDELSRDHDWGPGFYIWLEAKDYQTIGQELTEDYNNLPKEFRGFTRRNTEHGSRREGVVLVDDFIEYYLGRKAFDEWQTTGKISDDTMLSIMPSKLAAFCNGMIYHGKEDSKLCRIREYIKGYYSRSATTKLLCQTLAEFGQNAQYNYPRMKQRGDSIVAMQLLHTGLRKAVTAAYILNRMYVPHDKWIMKGTEQFSVLKEVPDMVSAITIEASKELLNLGDGTTLSKIEQLAATLLGEAVNQGYIGNIRLVNIPGKTEFFMDTYLEHYTSELMYRAKLCSMSHDELVEYIAKMEFDAFDKVKNAGGRADCQDDWYTFHIMRASQYTTWNDEMLIQYAVDFKLSMDRGWNPIMEKYGRMEESTNPEEWNKIKDNFPIIPPEKKQIMEEIIKIQVDWMEKFASKYPGLASHARRIHTSEDMPWDTSYETYLRGEMGTYSDKMLKLYGQFIVGIVKEEDNLAYRIMNETIRMYGYSDFEEAMSKMKE